MTVDPKAIIMDVDTGVDDALAIILAHQTPGAEVVAIGTVSGNVSAAQAATNTLKTLDALGASTPVAVGAPHALASEDFSPSTVHGSDGLGDAGLPDPTRAPTGEHAVDQLLRLVHERPGELSLFASGPLTNLALALERDPELPHLVQRGDGHGRRILRRWQCDRRRRSEYLLGSRGGGARLRRWTGP